MDSLIITFFITIAIPLVLMLFLLEKKSRLTVLFMIIGALMCVFASVINGSIQKAVNESVFQITTTYTPIVEELVKALPVLFFAFVFSDRRKTLVSLGMAVGIGFAILESTYILTSSSSTISIWWAIRRTFGAGLMHGICTASVGIGASFIRKKKKLFFPGTFAILSAAIIYHSIYNTLIQSQYKPIGLLLPIITYIPIIIALAITNRNEKKKQNADV